MYIAKVIKRVVASAKHPAYKSKRVYIVQPVDPDGTEKGEECVAVDYLGSGPGDIVICGGAPGVAQTVFGLERAPIRTLIIAIVDTVDYKGKTA
jgi:ethanolamine utilization protein EutN